MSDDKQTAKNQGSLGSGAALSTLVFGDEEVTEVRRVVVDPAADTLPELPELPETD